MRWFWIFTMLGMVTGCSAPMSEESGSNHNAESDKAVVLSQPPKATASHLEDLGPAPELLNETWLNVERPLRLADLKGKVILLDMWTFG